MRLRYERRCYIAVVVLLTTILAAVIAPERPPTRVYADLNCSSSGHTDDFTSTTLGSAWAARNMPGGTGPSYSLTSNSGCFRLAVPNTTVYDEWTTVDNAPRLERTDMGANSWILETKVNLQTYTQGASFHAGLFVRFGQFDSLLWGFFAGTNLQLDRTSGTGQIVKDVFYYSPTVYLQIQKADDTYTFMHKANATDRWIIDGKYRTTTAVVSVGFMTKTWGAANAVTADFDYADLSIGSFSDEDCASHDSNPFQYKYTMGSVFKRYVPLIGPALSYTANAGCLRMYLPSDQAYDLWGNGVNHDNAPQMQRSDLGTGDWTIETEVNLVVSSSHTSATSHAGLMVRFSQYDALTWGLMNGDHLEADRTGSGTASLVPNVPYSGTRVFLRIQRAAATNTYTFSYATAQAGPWTSAGTYTTTTVVQSAGMIVKTWTPTNVVVDFGYFYLTRVPLPAGDTCYSLNHTSDFIGSIDAAWTTDNAPGGGGPTIDATSNSNCVRITVPVGTPYDDWTSVDNAPKLWRGDMGSADWTIETKAILQNNMGTAFQSGLMVKFGTYDQFLWGFEGGTNLSLDHTRTPGTAGLVAVAYTQPVVYLRVQKVGATYTFSYKTPGNLTWTQAGSPQTYTGTVQQVGLFSKTWTSTGAGVTTDFDYVNLTKADNFSSTAIDPAWTPYVPLIGPTWSTTAHPGFMRLAIPGDQPYDHWASTDNAPQLRRGDMGSADWDAGVTETVVSSPGAGSNFHAGLMVWFSRYDALIWGIMRGDHLELERSGVKTGLISTTPYTGTTVALRIQKLGQYYLVYHKAPSDPSWTYDGSQGPITNAAPYVGLMGKTWINPVAVTVDFSNYAVTPISDQ